MSAEKNVFVITFVWLAILQILPIRIGYFLPLTSPSPIKRGRSQRKMVQSTPRFIPLRQQLQPTQFNPYVSHIRAVWAREACPSLHLPPPSLQGLGRVKTRLGAAGATKTDSLLRVSSLFLFFSRSFFMRKSLVHCNKEGWQWVPELLCLQVPSNIGDNAISCDHSLFSMGWWSNSTLSEW